MKRFLEVLASKPMVIVYLFSLVKVFSAAMGYEVAPETWTQYEEMANALCGVLVALGVFAYNPFEKEAK